MMSGGAVARFAQMSPVAAVAGVFLVILCAVAIDADQLAPVDPMAADYSATHAPPMPGHLMGTDQLGRDILSRVIYGARISLFVGFVSVLFGDSVGLIWGIVSGYLGGRVDLISQRLLDVVLSFPGLILAMLLLAGMGAGLQTVVTAIAVTRVPLMAPDHPFSGAGNEAIRFCRSIQIYRCVSATDHVARYCAADDRTIPGGRDGQHRRGDRH